MISRRHKAAIVIIPGILFVVSHLLSSIRGPFFLLSNFDPEYIYLLNSLKVLHFQAPFHIDHPGTPLQLIGALLIFLKFSINCVGANCVSFNDLVLTDPESYLRFIQWSLVLFMSASFAFSGYRIAIRKGIFVALIFQATCLSFSLVIISSTRVSPEPLIVAICLLLITALMEADLQNSIEKRNRIWIGFLLGMGLATRVTFLPLWLLGFLFPGLKGKLIVFGSALASFLLWTTPIIGQFGRLWSWFLSNLSHEGRYGSGSLGFPSLPGLIGNSKHLFHSEPSLVYIIVGLILFTAFQVISKITRRKGDWHEDKALLFGTAILFVYMIAGLKSGLIHYLLPAFFVSSWMLILLYEKQLTGRRVPGVIFPMLILVLIAYFSAPILRQWVAMMKRYNSDAVRLSGFVKENDCFVIPFYRASSQEYALALGNEYTNGFFSDDLKRHYPSSIFYNIWNDKFYTYGSWIEDGSVMELLSQHACIALQGTPASVPPPERLDGRFFLNPLWIKSEGLYQISRAANGR